jgi:hypothetical protein
VRGGLAQLFQAQALVETDAARPNREYLKVLGQCEYLKVLSHSMST